MAHPISTRISLRWVPDPPSEPTDTLVFNVGDYFMDLRVLKADTSIDWGMAGERQIISQNPRKSLSNS
jgi:Protein HRI1